MNLDVALEHISVAGIFAFAAYSIADKVMFSLRLKWGYLHKLEKKELKIRYRPTKPPLQPCRLCGGQSVFVTLDRETPYYFFVMCRVCRCETWKYKGGDGDEYALEDWNRGIVYLPEPEVDLKEELKEKAGEETK